MVLPQDPSTKATRLCSRLELRHRRRLRRRQDFERGASPLSSNRCPQAALKRSYRSDRVTRDWPVASRVRAAQSKTRVRGWMGIRI